MQDHVLPPLRRKHDVGLFELADIVVEAANGDFATRMEAMADGGVAGGDAVDVERHDDRLLGFRAEGAEDRLQRAHPAQRFAAPALDTIIGDALRAGGRAPRIDFGQGNERMMAGIASAMISSAGRPGFSMIAT